VEAGEQKKKDFPRPMPLGAIMQYFG